MILHLFNGFFGLSTGIKFGITSTEDTIPNPVAVPESGSFPISNQAMVVAVNKACLVENVVTTILQKTLHFLRGF